MDPLTRSSALLWSVARQGSLLRGASRPAQASARQCATCEGSSRASSRRAMLLQPPGPMANARGLATKASPSQAAEFSKRKPAARGGKKAAADAAAESTQASATPSDQAPATAEGSTSKAASEKAAAVAPAAESAPAAPPPELSEFLAPSPFDPTAKPVPFHVSTSSAAALADKFPLPYLSYPLGVPNRPIPLSGNVEMNKLRGERDVDKFNQKRMAKRKVLVKEATRGYFHDLHAMSSHGGKTWRAPGTLIREDRSLYFPDIIGSKLSDRRKASTTMLMQGNISLLCILTSKVSEEHTQSFYQPALDLYASHPRFRFVQINLQENKLKAYLLSLFLSSLRAQIPSPWHETYLLSSQSLELEREPLGLHNKHVGYTYLIDEQCRIRWAGCGFAEPAEANALIACAGVLLARVGGGGAGAAGRGKDGK